MEFRGGDAVRNFVDGKEVARYARAGVVTPDHTIRTKNWPLIVPAPEGGKLADFKSAVQRAAHDFIANYKAYFERNVARLGQSRIMLDPLPRVILVPGLGLFGLGRSKADASIAADIAEAAVAVITDAEATGTVPVDRRIRHVRVRVLAAGAGQAGAGEGAAAGRPDRGHHRRRRRHRRGDGARVRGGRRRGGAARRRRGRGQEKAEAVGGSALAIACDVTDAASVRVAFDRVVEAFGGVDIVVSNAGAAWQGRIGEVDEAVLRKSFELNFYGHQRVAQAAVRIMLAQGTGGCLLFNVSKQAVNPGPNFGPYGLPKAATLFLVRQYALDYGADGIRANAVNADRIRSGLLTDDFIKARSEARGLSEKDYMSGNLLQREVTAEDVAQAFLHQALELKTTGDVTTVDGGNIAAALR